MKLKTGIYQITNIINGKFYIGSAVNISKRRNQHVHYLRKNTHPNIHLQRSYNKHGEENFTIEVLEYCGLEELLEKEQFYIDTLNPPYNICKIAGSVMGRKDSEETKIKKSFNMKGKKHSEEAKKVMSEKAKGRIISVEQRVCISKALSKAVVQLDSRGNIIATYDSIIEASKKFNTSNINRALKYPNLKSAGFYWRYKN